MTERGLVRVVHDLSACTSQQAVMDVLRRAARGMSGADGITVVLRDGNLCHYAEENAVGPLWKGRRFPMETCISGWCMLHRRQVAIADIYADDRIPHDAYRPTFVKSLAMVPIRSEDPIGAIGAYWASRHEASAAELDVLQALADSASIAMRNLQLIDSLQAANRQKERFIAMLAHELRNPLAPMQNALALARERAGDRATLSYTHEVIGRQLRHLARAVDDLLDATRLSHDKLGLRRERVDLAAVVRECVADRRGGAEAAGVALTLEAPQVPAWVLGDAVRLAQVFGNLLDNAAKFTPRGGRITVRVVPDPAARRVDVSVADTGAGIDAETLARLFQAFSQAEQPLDRASGGLGLGLFVAKELVEGQEGTIEASSAGPGRGAEFNVRFPLQPEPAALAGPPAARVDGAKRLRILVVEDNADAAESLRQLLEHYGNQVTVAASGPEGLAAARRLRPDVVVCDIGLPGMNGFDVAAALRASAETAAIRLVAMTGYGAEDDRRRALGAGFDLHLVKPVEPGALIAQLAAA